MKSHFTLDRSRLSWLDAHIAAVITCGVVTLGWSIYQFIQLPPLTDWALLLSLSVLGIAAGALAVKIPGVSALVSASDTFFITSAILFGPAPAVLALLIDSTALAWRRRYGLTRLLFNASAPATSLWTATLVFQALAGHRQLLDSSLRVTDVILPLAALVTVYFALNSSLTAVAIALDSRISLFTVLKRLVPLSTNYIAAASAAFCFIVVIRAGGILAAAAVMPLVVVFHSTLRSVLGRLADANQHIANVDRLYLSTIEALATAIEAKDGVTHEHIRRVQRLSAGLAKALAIEDEPTLKSLAAAALLHDTGKLAVPEYILNKPGKLTPQEFEQMKLHVDVGGDILSSIDFPYPVVPIVRAHHENWDGSGYPRGLRGNEIPIGARILSVVDCYDALTSDRPYRPALGAEEAMAIITERRGTMYDPQVVDMFFAVHREIAAGALEPLPHQAALARISHAIAAPQAPAPIPAAAPDPARDAPDDLLAIVSLARIVGGETSFGDAAALAAGLLTRLLPDVTCVFYVRDHESGRLAARHATGEGAAAVSGLSIGMGERLSGWVASCRQSIVNSDAALDLFDRDVKLGSTLSTPLIDGDAVVAVLTAYSAVGEVFTENQSRTVQMLAPHLARIVGAALKHDDVRSSYELAVPRQVSPQASDLRIVSRR